MTPRTSAAKLVSAVALALLIGAPWAHGDLKAVNVAYAWDIVALSYQNSNVIINFDGGWVPFVHQLDFDNDTIAPSVPAYTPPPAYYACSSPCFTATKWAGTMDYGVYHEDNSPAGAPGFQHTRGWRIVRCDRTGKNGVPDGAFDGYDLDYSVPPAPYYDNSFDYLHNCSQWVNLTTGNYDIRTACTSGNCAFELVTTLHVNFDDDCNGTINPDVLPLLKGNAYNLCFYAEAQTPVPTTLPQWSGPLQARISAGGGEKTVNFNLTFGPTHVALSSFAGYAAGGQAVVEWVTASESQTVGFRLLRLDGAAGAYRDAAGAVLPALAGAHQGGTYRFVDAAALPGQSFTYTLVEVEANGQERSHGPFEVTFDVRAGAPAPAAPYSVSVTEPTPSEASRGAKARDTRKAGLALAKGRKGDMLKVTIGGTGLYYVDAEEIANLLATPVQRVTNLIKTGGLSLATQGREVAWLAGSGNAGLYFYGEGIDSIYTADNVYWLTPGRGQAMAAVAGKGPAPASGEGIFANFAHFERDLLPTPGLFDDPQADYFMWDYVYAGYPGYDTRSFTLATPGAAGAGDATLVAVLKGGSDTTANPDHHAVVKLNGTQIGQTTWNGLDEIALVLPFSASLLVDGDNTVQVIGKNDTGAPYSMFYIDWFDVTYPRRYRAVGDRLAARGDGNPVVTISGFSRPGISVFDLTDPKAPKLVTATTVDSAGGAYRVSFRPASASSAYLALTPAAVTAPGTIVADAPSSLKQKSNGADYLVIAAPGLREAVQPLAQYRAGQGLETMVVELEDVYDEFNAGVASPRAIKDLLSYASGNWRKAPRYVLLAGEGSFDYKDILGRGDNLLPVTLAATPWGLVAADNRFGDLTGDDGVPEMAIGRLPVVSGDEMATLAAKIIAYETSSPGLWTKRVLLAADSPGEAGNFPWDSDNLAALLPTDYTASKVYMSEHPLAEARQLLLGGLNDGALLLNYIGHGGLDRCTQAGLLTTPDVASLTNGDRLPVMTAMTCTVGRFEIPGYDSLAEALLLGNGRGAVAVWSPTGSSLNEDAVILDTGFFTAAFGGGDRALGDIAVAALKGYAGRDDAQRFMLDIYNILGDPALRLK